MVKVHAPSEGGGVTVMVPSLKRERQTTDSRVCFDPAVVAKAKAAQKKSGFWRW